MVIFTYSVFLVNWPQNPLNPFVFFYEIPMGLFRIIEALIVKKHVDGISNINSKSFGLYKNSKYDHKVTRG